MINKLQLKTIWSLIYENRTKVAIAGCIILFLMLLNQCNANFDAARAAKIEKDRSEQNIRSLTEDVKTYKNKADELSYKKAIAEMDLTELKRNYNELYADLQKEKGKVRVIIKTRVEYRDTGSVKNSVVALGADKYSVNFNYVSSDSTARVSGRNEIYAKIINDKKDSTRIFMTPDRTYIDNLAFKFSLTTGIKKDTDGIDRIFVTPSTDKVTITDIQGADVTNYMKDKCKDYIPAKKPKRFGLGAYVGYGIGVNGKGVQVAPQVGVGVTYSFVRF